MLLKAYANIHHERNHGEPPYNDIIAPITGYFLTLTLYTYTRLHGASEEPYWPFKKGMQVFLPIEETENLIHLGA